MEDDLSRQFSSACEQIKRTTDLDPETSLVFYGLYKQATCGDATEGTQRGFGAAQKYAAWKGNEGKTKEEAMREYVKSAKTVKMEGQETSFGNTVSRFTIESTSLNPSAVSNSEIDSLCIQIRSGKLDLSLISKLTASVHDTEGLTPLHHAADSGQTDIVHELIFTYSADVNSQDLAGMTPLHYAVVLESAEVVRELMRSGKVDGEIRDAEGQTAREMASEEMREVLEEKTE